MNSTFKALMATIFLFAIMLYANTDVTGKDNNVSKYEQNEQVDENVSIHENERSIK